MTDELKSSLLGRSLSVKKDQFHRQNSETHFVDDEFDPMDVEVSGSHIVAPKWTSDDLALLYRLIKDRHKITPLAAPQKYMAGDLGIDHLPPLVPPEKDGRKAAVLMPLIERADDHHVLLTRRTDHLSAHPGQVAFPGGRQEEKDADIIETALRETHEEVGITPNHVEVLGEIGLYRTFSGYHITPVLGVLQQGYEIVPDPNEVADVFEVPLAFLLDPNNHQHLSKEFKGFERHYYAMPYRGYYIWGVTAGILVKLSLSLYQHVQNHKRVGAFK